MRNGVILCGIAVALSVVCGKARAAVLTDVELEAIGRTVYAEAAREPIDGKVAVFDTILNRLRSGEFGSSAIDVIEQRNEFEPVTRAGGWSRLPSLGADQRKEWEVIVQLKAKGLLGDPTNGATFFQNPKVVADRAQKGAVRAALVDFGGMPVVAEIGNHRFYSPSGSKAGRASRIEIDNAPKPSPPRNLGSPFIAVNNISERRQ